MNGGRRERLGPSVVVDGGSFAFLLRASTGTLRADNCSFSCSLLSDCSSSSPILTRVV